MLYCLSIFIAMSSPSRKSWYEYIITFIANTRGQEPPPSKEPCWPSLPSNNIRLEPEGIIPPLEEGDGDLMLRGLFFYFYLYLSWREFRERKPIHTLFDRNNNKIIYKNGNVRRARAQFSFLTHWKSFAPT